MADLDDDIARKGADDLEGTAASPGVGEDSDPKPRAHRKAQVAAVVLFVVAVLLVLFDSGGRFLGYTCAFTGAFVLAFSYAARVLRRVMLVILAVIVVAIAVVEVPIVRESLAAPSEEADYIIVLGAAVRGETPSLAMRERVEAAVEFLRAHPDCKAVLSGGKGRGESVTEAEAMRRLIVAEGISADRLILEQKSTSTRENLKFSFEAILDDGGDPATAAVVSSEYHICRAKMIARGLGVEVGAVPATTTHLDVRLNYFLREAFAVTYQALFGSNG